MSTTVPNRILSYYTVHFTIDLFTFNWRVFLSESNRTSNEIQTINIYRESERKRERGSEGGIESEGERDRGGGERGEEVVLGEAIGCTAQCAYNS